MKKLLTLFLLLFSLNAFSSGSKIEIPKYDWSWKGFFGTYDRASAQRGLKVYREVCSGCHSLNLISYRNLETLGFNEAEIKAIASASLVEDGPNADGEMFEREALPSDRFASPYPNIQAARAANNGALPPDLSLIVKARAKGADYIKSLLLGYSEAPHGITVPSGQYYNQFMEGNLIAMPAPLAEGAVDYDDGTENSIDQMATDVTTFLAWAAEPSLEDRKRIGLKVILFLVVLFVLAYISKQNIWRDVKY
jgi:ubiquinol-cytochrome c reductase cytochrome c1 subunit